MRLGKFTLGYIFTVGTAAVVFILMVKFVGKRWRVPVLSTVANSV